MFQAMKSLRRLFIAVVGGTVLLIGIVMILLPGPSTLIIIGGLAILAVEFAWARHWLHKARQYLPGSRGKKSNDAVPPLTSIEKEPD